MSEQFDPTNTPEDAIPEMQVEERRASVVLRRDDARETRLASMTAAHQSLAEALRLIHRLILIVMIGLVALFFFSGFRSINETERGVRLLFGKAVSSELSPGFRFSWPRPVGDIRKVDVAQQSVLIHRAFYPPVSERQQIRSIRDLGIGSFNLDPKVAGSVITGDGSLAHLRLNADYQVENPVAFLENIGDDAAADRIVTSVVQQAAVRVVAETTIDELLLRRGDLASPEDQEPPAPAPDAATAPATPPAAPTAATPAASDAEPDPADPEPTKPDASDPIPAVQLAPEVDIELRMREIAQASLDAINSGIRVTRIAIFEATPPARLTSDFDKVQQARYEASKTVDASRLIYDGTLNAAAGAAYRPMLALIDLYGRQLDSGEDEAAIETLETIFALLRGDYANKPLVVDGVDYGPVTASGAASRAISEAQQYRFTARKEAEEVASTFRAKLSQYRANRKVFIAREWAEAMQQFAGRPYVDVFLLPDGTQDLALLLNADPDIARDIQRAIQRRRLEENMEFRAGMEAGEINRSSREQ